VSKYNLLMRSVVSRSRIWGATRRR